MSRQPESLMKVKARESVPNRANEGSLPVRGRDIPDSSGQDYAGDGLPLFYRVLIINVLVVLLGGLAGTYLAYQLSGLLKFDVATHFLLIGATFLVASIVNLLLLRFAFAPLTHMKNLVRDVRSGNTRARAKVQDIRDPDFAEFGLALNAMLDEIEAKAAVIEADRDRIVHLTRLALSAEEAERKRIARELHDDTGQMLSALLLRLERMLSDDSLPGHTRSALAELKDNTQHSLHELRRLMLELRPAILDDLGLVPAIRWLIKERVHPHQIETRIEEEGMEDVRLNPEVETALFRIAQEGLSNVVRHSQAYKARVSLVNDGHSVQLTIADDGTGFDMQSVRERAAGEGRLGIFGMDERAGLLGGTLTIESQSGEGTMGTRLVARIPLEVAG